MVCNSGTFRRPCPLHRIQSEEPQHLDVKVKLSIKTEINLSHTYRKNSVHWCYIFPSVELKCHSVGRALPAKRISPAARSEPVYGPGVTGDISVMSASNMSHRFEYSHSTALVTWPRHFTFRTLDTGFLSKKTHIWYCLFYSRVGDVRKTLPADNLPSSNARPIS